MKLKEKVPVSGAAGYILLLATRNTDSDFASYFSASRVHLIGRG